MAKGIPPRSAYLGSDLPENELMMPAARTPEPGPVLPDTGAAPIPPEGELGLAPGQPPNDPMTGNPEEFWEQDLAGAAQRAGLDPTLLKGPVEGMPVSKWIEALRPLQEQLTTDTEITAFEGMLDAWGALGSEGATTAGKPGAANAPPVDPTFRPDRPGSNRY